MPRIIFMGTPEFAVPSLDLLVSSGLAPVAVVTAPDRRRGRGQSMSPSAVKQSAVRHGIEEILQPESVKSAEFAEQVEALKADIQVVVAFRILPPAVFQKATLGAFNLHGSLLPKYRGAAPIHRAVLAGDRETGVTTFFLQEKVDTGNLLLARSMSIGENETTGDVHDRMMFLGAEVVLETVQMILAGEVDARPQDDALASPAPKVSVAEAELTWKRPSSVVHNHIRGFSPVPGAYSYFQGQRTKFYRSLDRPDVNAGSAGRPGEVLACDDCLLIACDPGAVEITELQAEGKKRMPASEFLKGAPLKLGDVYQ